MSDRGRVRPLERRDLAGLVELCREHACYERASWSDHEREEKLATLFLGSGFLSSGRPMCWVVDGSDELAGFASANLELSTWDAAQYLHLDCLYLRAAYRGQGFGRVLIEEVARVALETGAVNVQWQTPVWNDDAARFYERLGAVAAKKLRFTLHRETCSRPLTPRSLLSLPAACRPGDPFSSRLNTPIWRPTFGTRLRLS